MLLDTDSFVRAGFDATVRSALEAGAGMNLFEHTDPYPDFGPFETDLPGLGRYVLDSKQSRMFNSGLVAARPEHAELLDDALVLTATVVVGWPEAAHRRAVRLLRVLSTCRRADPADPSRFRALLSALVQALHAAEIAGASD